MRDIVVTPMRHLVVQRLERPLEHLGRPRDLERAARRQPEEREQVGGRARP